MSRYAPSWAAPTPRPRRWLLPAHRWLGLLLCLMLAGWFGSGLVMLYVSAPSLTEAQRLRHLSPLVLEDCCVLEAALAAAPTAPVLRMSLQRPIYLAGTADGPVTRYADTGRAVDGHDRGRALAVAAAFVDVEPARLRHLGLIEADQWTHSSFNDVHRPLHKLAVADGAGTRVYVSSRTGEVVLTTSRAERGWNWGGMVSHWLYFQPLREHPALWRQLLIGLAAGAVLLALSGLLLGLLRLPLLRGAGRRRRTARARLSRWHHGAGLVFGLLALSWAASGLLMMNPGGLFEHARIEAAERRSLTAGAPAYGQARLSPQEALARAEAAVPGLQARELRWLRFDGELYYRLLTADGTGHLVHADSGEVRAALPAARLEALAARLRAEPPLESLWLHGYDHYYYDRRGPRSLPVLRLKYADGLWYYLDPASGRIVAKLGRGDRLHRWLVNGVHTLDLPGLRERPLLRQGVMTGLLLGGLLLSLTGVALGIRRLWPRRRHVSAAAAAVEVAGG